MDWSCISGSRWVPSVVYSNSIHDNSTKNSAVAIAQSLNGSLLNYNDYCSECPDKRRCEEFRVLLQLARTKLGARSIWRNLAHSASPRWRALHSYVAAQFESAAYRSLNYWYFDTVTVPCLKHTLRLMGRCVHWWLGFPSPPWVSPRGYQPYCLCRPHFKSIF